MKLTKQQYLKQMGIELWRLKSTESTPSSTPCLLVIGPEFTESQADSAQKLLDSMLATIRFSPLNIHILAVSDKKLSTPNSSLIQQIKALNPSILLATGLNISQFLLKSTQPLDHLRQTIHHYEPLKVPLIVTFHPTHLLTTPKDKHKAFLDLCLLTDILNEH